MSNENGLTGAAEAAHHRETRNPERSEEPNTAEAASESNPRLDRARLESDHDPCPTTSRGVSARQGLGETSRTA